MKRLTLLILLLAHNAWAGDAYFVKKGGSDAANGQSWANAWATPERADTVMAIGDTVIFGSGVWLGVHLDAKGTDAKRESTWVADPGYWARSWTVYACSSWYTNLGNPSAQAAGVKNGSDEWRTRLYSALAVPRGSISVYDTLGDGDTVYCFSFDNVDAEWTWNFEYACVGDEGWGDATNCRWVGCFTQGFSYPDTTLDSQFVPIETKAISPWVFATAYAQLTQPGEMFYDYNANKVYFIPYGNDTAGCFFAIADNPTMAFTPSRYGGDTIAFVRIYGLELKSGKGGAITFATVGNSGGGVSESTFIEQCHIGMASTSTGDNPGAIQVLGEQGNYHNRWTYITNCTLDWAMHTKRNSTAPPPWNAYDRQSEWSRGANVVTYSTRFMRIDSCNLLGPSQCGVNFKNDMYSTSPTVASTGNCVTNSYITGAYEAGVALGCYPEKDSIYGNIIVGNSHTRTVGIIWAPSHGPYKVYYPWKCFVANNTIYNCEAGGLLMLDPVGDFGSGCPGDSNTFKSNIVKNWWTYNDGNRCAWSIEKYHNCPSDWDTTFHQTIDYNIWDNDSTPANVFYIDNAYRDWTYWHTTKGWDAHGTWDTDPGFDSVSASNPWLGFARSSASDEISDSYGGKTWTLIGAVQEVDSCPTVTRDSVPSGATTRDITPNYVFDIADGTSDTVAYKVLRDTYSPPTTSRFSDTVATPATNITHTESGLADRTTYYWRIAYTDTVDISDGSCTETTSVYSYFVDTVKCPVAASVTPANGSTVTADTVRPTCNFQTDDYSNIIVRFYGETGDVTPDVLLKTDTLTADSVGWNDFKWTGLTNGLTYYWQVVIQDPDCTDSTEIRSFNVVYTTGVIPTIEIEGTEIEGITIGKAHENENRSGTREVGWGALGMAVGADTRSRTYSGPACLAVYTDAR